MTPEFHRWYELNVRRMDGTPKQAAWVAWQHWYNLSHPTPTGDETGLCRVCGTATDAERHCPYCRVGGKFSASAFALATGNPREGPALVSQWPPVGQPRPVLTLLPDASLWGNLSDLMTP